MNTATVRFLAGIFLLVTNQAVGWGGMLLFGNLARRTGRHVYYFFGLSVYIISWIMLLAGVYLVGVAQALAVMRYLPDWLIALAVAGAAVSYYFWRRRAREKAASDEIGNE